jgi:hypothetical protein
VLVVLSFIDVVIGLGQTITQKTIESAYGFHILCPFCAAYSGQILLYNLDEVWLSYSSKDLRERIPFSPKIPGLFSNSYKPIPNELINQCIQTQFFVFGFYSQKFENNLSVSKKKKKKTHIYKKAKIPTKVS